MVTATAKEASVKEQIKAGIGEGFLKQYFGGKTFLHCLVELVKNSRDWSAKGIFILTNIAKDIIQIVDNGIGMDRENRKAFCSINMGTAKGPRQSGKFGSGVKHFLFSWCKSVEVVTAPTDDQDYVYTFGYSTAEYERLVLSGGTVPSRREKKTRETWPHDFPTGTAITFKLVDARSRAIVRGKRLAEELSARLPRKYEEYLQVDGEPIPVKEIVGDFDSLEQHQVLGPVTFELYRPVRPHAEEELRLTAGEVGEVPFRNFFRVVGDLRGQVPGVFLHDEVCGTISVPFLREYAVEDRFTLNPSIADDPRIGHFVRLLQNFSPEIQRRLKVRFRSGAAAGADVTEIEEIVTAINAVYDPENKGPQIKVKGPPDEEKKEKGKTTKSAPPFFLSLQAEYEIGEEIRIEAKIRSDLAQSYTIDDLEWFTDRALAKNVRKIEDGITMIAARQGVGAVRVDLKGTPFSREVKYEVVAERAFRLSRGFAEVVIGADLEISAVNTDKLEGSVAWQHAGVGEVEIKEDALVFRSTSDGRAMIKAHDSGNPKRIASCDIVVVPKVAKTLCIRGEYFVYEYTEVLNAPQFAKPITMIRGGAAHRLVFNVSAPSYKAALSGADLKGYLLHAIALEFARFAKIDLTDLKLEEVEPRDLPVFLQDIAKDGYEVLGELFEKVG